MPRLAALLSSLFSARPLLLLLVLAEIILLIRVGLPSPLAAEISAAEKAGTKVPWKTCVSLGLSIASLLGLALVRKPSESPAPLSAGDFRLFTLGLLIAVVLGTGLRWNLAGRSMWWDELWNFRENSHGKYSQDSEGNLRFRTADWARATWYYPKPTHHAPMALAVKASLGVWRTLTGADNAEFSDRTARFPALLASALAIIGIGLLLRCWGHPFPGVVAALLLAVHPLHIRYGIDARGFAFVVPAVIYGLLALTLVIRTRSYQRGWLALFAFCLFMLMYAFPVGIWYPLGLVMVGLWYLRPAIAGAGSSTADRWRPCLRLVVACSFAALAFFHLFLPNLIQSHYWRITDAHFLTGRLLSETWTQLCFGIPNEVAGGDDGRGLTSLSGLVGGRHWLAWTLRSTLTVLALVGIARLFLRPRRLPGFAFLAMLIAAALYLLTNYLAEQHYYYRYLIHLVPLYVAGLGLGLHLLGGIITTRSYAPIHEVAKELDRLVAEEDAEVFGFGHGAKVLNVYRPDTAFALEREDGAQKLAAFVSSESGRPGYVFVGHRAFNAHHFPEAMKQLFDGAARFGEARTYRGLEADFTYRILRVR